jgi:putative FmdB family regulatory protein
VRGAALTARQQKSRIEESEWKQWKGSMPLYEYKCGACGHQFERIVKFSDAPVKTCPQCGKDTAEQMIHAPAVQFKGSGWYVSDYARKGGAASKSAGGEKVSGSADGGAKEGAPAPGASSEKSSESSSGTKAGDSAKPSGDKGGEKK